MGHVRKSEGRDVTKIAGLTGIRRVKREGWVENKKPISQNATAKVRTAPVGRVKAPRGGGRAAQGKARIT